LPAAAMLDGACDRGGACPVGLHDYLILLQWVVGLQQQCGMFMLNAEVVFLSSAGPGYVCI